MLYKVELLLSYFLLFFSNYILVYVILRSVVQASFLHSIGYAKWYIAVVPFGMLFVKRELASLNIVVIILNIVTVLMYLFLTSNLVIVATAISTTVYSDYVLCKYCLTSYNTILYTTPTKYFYALKEVLKWWR